MCPAPQSPIGDVLDEEPARGSTTGTGRPALVIDAHAGLLLDANREGWALWGLDPARAALPIAIDCAMPALQRLREMAHAQADRVDEPISLAFWTARGLVQLACRVERREIPGAGPAMLVTALHAAPTAAKPEAKPLAARPQSPVSGLARRGHGVDLDVALDAWLAHELRTPLSAVIAYAEILKSEHFGPIANPRYKSYACDIYSSARHALGVVDSMLQGDRARTALPTLSFADLDPAAVVEGCLTVARPLAERAGLELAADVPAHLPRIVADELALRQMLLNLLSNAIKFARAGDRVAVRVVYTCDGPLTISVTDTGPGMGPSPGMGEPPKAERAGLGLGLPLTRALAAANGAKLAVESTPGQGTRVTISFGKDRIVPV
jgi:signal transduction histidine kinase